MADGRVQRLQFRTTAQGALDCLPHPEGGFVHYADYAKIETELKETKRALEIMALDPEEFAVYLALAREEIKDESCE
jgi:hypothetical protein